MVQHDDTIYQPRGYQDDLDTGDDMNDPIIPEETDDPTREFDIPDDELVDELNRLDPDNNRDYNDSEDEREDIEDRDQDAGDATKY